MSNHYRQWFWDGEWHDKPKPKDELVLDLITVPLPEGFMELDRELRLEIIGYLFGWPIEVVKGKTDETDQG